MTLQTNLETWINDQPAILPRNPKPTQEAAALKIKYALKGQRMAVYREIAVAGAYGATDSEIQQALDMDGNSARPRRRELQLAGWIRDGGTTRANRRGNLEIVWVAL